MASVFYSLLCHRYAAMKAIFRISASSHNIVQALPSARVPARSSRLFRQCACSLLALFLSLPPAVFAQADGLPELGEAARADLSPQIERRIGERIMNEIRQREPAYVEDPEISDYLNRLGRRLVEASSDPTGRFYFFAIRDNAINAFAMFGGYIGVNTGTILTAQTESELAGVIAHEIGHVTQNHLARQIAKEKQNTVPMLIAMAVGILAARSNSDAAMGAIVGAQAGAAQAHLAYSREFEREADRVGYQILSKAGFDVRGMPDFFGRMQQSTRIYESAAPVYLRSHPLTIERLSDMQNRVRESPYKQIVSHLDFYLVRAKLRAYQGTPEEAVRDFDIQVKERKSVSLAAARYGLAAAYLRAKNTQAAQRELESLLALRVASPLISGLAGAIRMAAHDAAGAASVYRESLQRFPQARSLVYGYADALFDARRFDTLLDFLESRLRQNQADARLYAIQAKTYAALGKRFQQHRAQAEAYALEGQLGAAIEQLQYAQQAKDGDFYEQSAVDARLRELRQQQAEEDRQKKDL